MSLLVCLCMPQLVKLQRIFRWVLIGYRALVVVMCAFFFFQAEDGIRDLTVTGVQTCALPIFKALRSTPLCAKESPFCESPFNRRDNVRRICGRRGDSCLFRRENSERRAGHPRSRAFRRWSRLDRKSTRLNSSHSQISYAVFCL